ncbi:MAG: aspartate--tRNA ligase [Acidimicrobiia bacterium]|nr:aspartate--tRNA ligase [Acidimicrobiia bacterium]MDH5504182.1 aspartate--tRNA ligase [Acidimicrobiia bacterium]
MAQEPLRTDYAGELTADRIGDTVRLAGWVAKRRDHGGVVFVDLRDVKGIVQVVIDPMEIPAAHELRMEYCVSLVGVVRSRMEGTENPDMPTGAVEVGVTEITVLSASDPLPFMIDDRADADELIRLEYRYLDFRRAPMAAALRARGAAVHAMRSAMADGGFLEVETPTLIASTPEGARDMLVPSRLRQGEFYALPQSPQLFKQLLMVGGVDRYYQIARCYRDEDFRSDRQLEFTQLDIEGSFWTAADVQATIETAIAAAVRAVRGHEISRPFGRLTYAAAMDRFGSDKPDVRFGMEVTDVSSVFTGSEFKGFGGALDAGGVVRGINGGPLGLSRSGFDGLVADAQALGAKGLAWLVVEDDGTWRSPIAKFLSEAELGGLKERFDAKPGDTVLLVADSAKLAGAVLGSLRLQLGRPAGHEELAFTWVTDFPVFDVDDDGSLAPAHHPFTQPVSLDDMVERPETAIAQAYDLVLNGSELGSGSVRIHDPGVQAKVFEVLGISNEEAQSRFGWFIRALRYGTPPHAGFAVGVDRLLAILLERESIRDVIPFPKTQRGIDPMTGSPTRVTDVQLRELGVDLRPEVKARLAKEAAAD